MTAPGGLPARENRKVVVAEAHAAQTLIAARLRELHRGGQRPLLSMDLDDTFLPFGQVITETELALLSGWLDAGGLLAFNTLAPKEWFYRRVIARLVTCCHRNHCAHLLKGLSWIVSGGREIFVYDGAHGGYLRIHAAAFSTKAEGLRRLLDYLNQPVALLALYGDRFDDPGNDGNALGVHDIPLIINVGADQITPASDTGQHFVNLAEKGPRATLRHLSFLTEALGELSIPSSEEPGDFPEATPAWRFERADTGSRPRGVEVHGPGFLWSWTDQGRSWLTALIQNSAQSAYRAPLPGDAAGFTFFWTGGADTASGQSPGHWEGRDFRI